ncbi:hypothetical protein [Aliiruegeria lutimaris]|uniref:EF hand n=1 Tax=Aliiruegeria lutimaris TaxID=571298 RepID=A0A1G8YHZ8_9RHOB|nr:hypothetical protein [Aliiruegeria lutimaris]SDK02277.1 EF hand [Aliiruegeria lutimaris]
MKRSRKIAVALISFTAVGAAVAIPALAHGPQGGGWMQNLQGGPGGMMQGWQGGPGMMRGQGGYGGMEPGAMRGMSPAMMGGPGMMGRPAGPGMMPGFGGPGMMGGVFGDLDANDDATVTADEARDGMAAALAENDGNGDGTLSLEEFKALHDQAIRPQMVDRFQALDEDGDGQLTQDEVTAPADWMARMQARRAAFWQDCPWLQDDSQADAPEGKN